MLNSYRGVLQPKASLDTGIGMRRDLDNKYRTVPLTLTRLSELQSSNIDLSVGEGLIEK